MTKLENINKYSHQDLQKMANDMGLSIKKQGKSGYANKLKKELY